ncbi:MAG: hypothetical protein KKD44_29210 [Proteobacteria bacterium]|nr:hypothetical protein [Pseudomonadota bacterium]
MSDLAVNMKQVIGVRFPEPHRGMSSEYCYWAERNTVSIGDWVVVKVNATFKCAKVSQVGGFTKAERDKACKWIVQIIDVKAYDQKLAKERAVQEIRGLLRERREEMEDIDLYKRLAKDDAVMAELIQKLTDIESGKEVPLLDMKEDSDTLL